MEAETDQKSIVKKLRSYLSIKKGDKSSIMDTTDLLSKSRTKSTDKKSKRKVCPSGCFSVYVGPEKQRFVIKTEFANHPLFRMLLEDAELEYGFNSEGPLLIPCEVDLFCKILVEIYTCKDFDQYYSCGSCSPFNRGRRFGNTHGYHSSYGLLTPSNIDQYCSPTTN